MRVRLTQKHAEVIDGVSLEGHRPGDVFDLPAKDAKLLVAEHWAILERRQREKPVEHRRREGDYSRSGPHTS